MKKYFKRYIQGYSQAKHNLNEYIILTKDGKWEDLSVTNLYFCSKKEFQEKGSKREILKTLLTLRPEISDAEISQQT